MKCYFQFAMCSLIGSLCFLSQAQAGMPSVTLSDIFKMRLDTISFFLVVYLLCAWGVKKLWNGLTTDFPRLPRLSYWRALGLLTIWALLFIIVLTMISGARELMTPGAWEKQGATYKLVTPLEQSSSASEKKP